MNKESRPEVLIERDGKTWRWGDSSYLKHWNGFKFTLNGALFKSFALPIAAAIGFIAYKVSRTELPDHSGKRIDTPGVTIGVPIIESKILMTQDLVNQLTPKRVDVSPMGGIKVYNLANLTDLPVGAETKAVLVSGASNGIVKARLVAPMLIEGEPILPEGAVVFGHGKSTEERLFVEFDKAVMPSGDAYSIRAQAFDASDKILGLKGAMVGTKTKKMIMGMALGFLGGMADGLQDTSGSLFQVRRPSVRDAALGGTAKATLDQSQLYLDQIKNAPDIIEVKEGTEFYLIIDEPKPKQENSKNG